MSVPVGKRCRALVDRTSGTPTPRTCRRKAVGFFGVYLCAQHLELARARDRRIFGDTPSSPYVDPDEAGVEPPAAA